MKFELKRDWSKSKTYKSTYLAIEAQNVQYVSVPGKKQAAELQKTALAKKWASSRSAHGS